MRQKFKNIKITLPITFTISGGVIRSGNTPEEGAFSHDPEVYIDSGWVGDRVLSDWMIGHLEDEFQADLLDQLEGQI